MVVLMLSHSIRIMDPNSSLEKICLGDDMIVISSDKIKGLGDWNSPEYQDTAGSKGKKVMNAHSFYIMETDEISERYIAPCFVNGLEAYDGEINLALDENLISNEYVVKNGVIIVYPKPDPFDDDSEKTGKSSDDWDQLIDFNFDDVPKFGDELPPFVCKAGKSNRNKKKEMENLDLFYQDIGPSSSTGRHLTQNIGPSSSTRRHLTQGEAEKEALADTVTHPKVCFVEEGVGVTTLIVKFIILDILIDHDAPIVVSHRFLLPLKQVNWKPKYKGSYTKGEEATGQWQRKIRITYPYGNAYLQGFTTKNMDRKLSKYHNREAKSRYNTRLAQLFPRHIYSPCVMNWDILNRMGCDGVIDDHEEIFTSVAWIRAYNINEQIYAGLCHEFYSTYEFDEVCANDELQTKKIIKFRLGGRSHNLTLLEFARRLGLYQATELDEDRFNVYFEGGLRSDEHFNAQEYWMSIGREESLSLSRRHASTIRFPILRVIHKIITYGLCQRTTGYDKIQKNDLWLLSMFDTRHQNGYANVAWLIMRWMKRKGARTQKESQICCGQFITKLARKTKVLTDDVIRSLSAPIYCRDLDTTTLRELIDSEGRLIPEDPQPGVPREAIERMEYMQSYHWDKYQGVFEHMAGVYNVPLQGAYNPPGYAQPQYDQYYQQYPPQYQPPQQDDDE
ncbi:hypothetical protein Tco_0277217 [Tanacetum coccineum]